MSVDISGPGRRAPGQPRGAPAARPGAVIEAAGLGYAVRFGPNRRNRAMLVLDEPAFQALVRTRR
jgi:hypothetical protein